MTDALFVLAMLVFIVEGALERRWHAEERRRLTAAALAPTPQAAVHAIADLKPADERRHEPRPIPLGL